MRSIKVKSIRDAVIRLVKEANFVLRTDVLQALRLALQNEQNRRAKKLLKAIVENAGIARGENLAICQDTGFPVVFVEIGQEVRIEGGSLRAAINEGISSGYRQAHLRSSIIRDPILRGRPGFLPTLIHTEIVRGKNLKLAVLPKGFGCENKSQVKMFRPTADIGEIKSFIINAVRDAGPDACPPYVLGIGIGGTQDYACFLAKKALLRKITPHFRVGNIYYTRKSVVALERELFVEINKLNIGPMGLGGKTTALGVNIETYPTHIAGLPVAVNISCHALRSASASL